MITKEAIKAAAERDIDVFNRNWKEDYRHQLVTMYIRAIDWYKNQLFLLDKSQSVEPDKAESKWNRFFIVMYCGMANNQWITGQINFRTVDNYLNQKLAVETIEEKSGVKNAVFTNIIELSKSDYDNFIEVEATI